MNDDERGEAVVEALKDFRDNARDLLKERYLELGGSAGKPKAVNSNLPPLPPGFAMQR